MRTNTSRAAWMSAVIAALLVLPSLAQPTTPIPQPRLVRSSQADLQAAVVESATVRSRVVGHHASSQIEIVLRNPNASVIESALEFPLREGQTVTGFALESLDGSRFLTAAPVEKAKGQAVFEQIVREGVDPALLEKTAGNNFKLRVYPISAKGTRRIRLEISEFLSPFANGKLQYQIPHLLKDAQAQKITWSVELPGIKQGVITKSNGLKSAVLKRVNDSTVMEYSPSGKWGTAPYWLSWPVQNQAFTDFGSLDGQNYFHAQIPLKIADAARKPPELVTVVWDASGSGLQRDHKREFDFLEELFKRLVNVKVQLVETHVLAQPAQWYDVSKGNWDALRSALEKVQYDGASNPALWSSAALATKYPALEGLDNNKHLTLVFTDGIGNWGHPEPAATGTTIYTVSASEGANSGALRALAEPTGGQWIDLLPTPVDQAVAAVNRARARLVRVSGDGIDQVVSVSPYPERGLIQIAGRISQERATATLEFALPNGTVERRVFELKPSLQAAPIAPSLTPQRWAAMKIAQLETNARLHQTEIQRIGSEFGVVSSRTSLIILERLEDYLRFDVMPSDPQWREEFKKRAVAKASREVEERTRHLARLSTSFADRAAWWAKSFPKGPLPQPVVAKVDVPPPVSPPARASMAASVAERMAFHAPAPRPFSEPERPRSAVPVSALRPAPMPAPAPMAAAPRDPTQPSSPAGIARPAGPAEIAISVQKQQIDAAYAQRLRDAKPDERFAIYLDEKGANAKSAAYYLDASEIFFEKGQHALGLRILSNLAEIQNEDRALLRILAYRLQQAKQYEQAIILFKQVLVLAPNEPQSWRDLGLAYAANGQAQQAVDALWTTAQRNWDVRFAEIGLIALGELNAIVSANPGLDLSRVDPQFIRPMPVDMRVVLNWDADNTDIDLWVRDPNGHDAYFAQQLTYQGGRMSRDFTGGYGPEEFLLKDPKPGRYEVRGKFFGSRQQKFSPYTTLMLRFFTGYGTANQKEQSVILRLPDRGSEVMVGSFEVKP